MVELISLSQFIYEPEAFKVNSRLKQLRVINYIFSVQDNSKIFEFFKNKRNDHNTHE